MKVFILGFGSVLVFASQLTTLGQSCSESLLLQTRAHGSAANKQGTQEFVHEDTGPVIHYYKKYEITTSSHDGSSSVTTNSGGINCFGTYVSTNTSSTDMSNLKRTQIRDIWAETDTFQYSGTYTVVETTDASGSHSCANNCGGRNVWDTDHYTHNVSETLSLVDGVPHWIGTDSTSDTTHWNSICMGDGHTYTDTNVVSTTSTSINSAMDYNTNPAGCIVCGGVSSSGCTVSIVSHQTTRTTTRSDPSPASGNSSEILSDEFTRPELVAKVRTQIAPFVVNEAEWGGAGATAYCTLSSDETYAEGANLEFRFQAVDLHPNEKYTVYYVEQTTIGTTAQPPKTNTISFTAGSTTKTFGPFSHSMPGFVGSFAIVDAWIKNESTGCTSSCQDPNSAPYPGAIRAAVSSVDFTIALGLDTGGVSAGYLAVRGEEPSSNLATPESLDAIVTPGVEVIRAGYSNLIRQVKAPQILADVIQVTDFRYDVKLYPLSQVGAKGGDGLYAVSGTPLKTVTVQNPNASLASINTLTIAVQEGVTTDTWTYTWDVTIVGWRLTSPGNLREETVVTSVSGTTTTVTRNTGYPSGATVRTSIETYQDFGQGPRLIKLQNGSGTDALLTTYDYYTSIWDPNGTLPPLKQVIYADGSWEGYDYIETWGDGRIARKYTPFESSAPTFDPSLCRTTDLDYTPVGTGDDGSIQPREARTEIDKVKGVEVGRRYHVYTASQEQDIICTVSGAAWNASGNLVKTRKYYTSGAFNGYLKTVQYPDGTLDAWSYTDNGNGTITETFDHGQPDASFASVIDGTRIITTTGTFKEILTKVTKDIVANVTLANEAYSNFDSFRRAGRVTYLDNTFVDTTYACCGIDTTIDRDKATNTFVYDALRRQIGNTQLGITYLNILDPAGSTLIQERISTNNDIVILRRIAYDTAGRPKSETNAFFGVTSFSYSTNSNGLQITTITAPDNGTTIRSVNRDRSIESLTGTAVYPIRYEYFDSVAGALRTIEIKIDSIAGNTNEWAKTYFDLAGRVYQRVYPTNSTGTAAETLFYNSKGQLWKVIDADGVTTMYAYNLRGEQTDTVVDLNGNGQIDYGVDRITRNDPTIVAGARRTTTYRWFPGDNAAGTAVGRLDRSFDGLQITETLLTNGVSGPSWTIQTAYTGDGSRFVTNSTPSGGKSIQQFSFGRIVADIRQDSNGVQLLKTSYVYDPQGRNQAIIDARNGMTTFGYNSSDALATTTSPQPGTGASPQITTLLYDTSGRIYKTVFADGAWVTNDFFQTGNIKKTAGARVYPAAYTYDSQGRTLTLTTWTNASSSTGPSITYWKYDGYRGVLTNKLYGSSAGPTYGYTPAGRRASRKWARGVTTTYVYEAAGALYKTLYDDGATPGTTNTYDRLGRLGSVSNGDITAAVVYGRNDNLLSETYSGGALNGLAVTNGYDGYLRRASATVAGYAGSLNAYSYDSSDRLAIINSGNYSASYTYVPNSLLIQRITFKQNAVTNLVSSRKYDFHNRLQSINSAPSGTNTSAFYYGYVYNDANQRTRVTQADGSYWAYNYDWLGQVTSGVKYWPDGVPIEGEQFGYTFDDIGNRRSTLQGGNSVGQGLRLASYTPNSVNQIASRVVPPAVDILGSSTATNTVTINSISAQFRHGAFFRHELSVANSSGPSWTPVTVSADTIKAGNILTPPATQTFGYDADGNLTNDLVWRYIWDAENRLSEVQPLTNNPAGSKRWLKFAYDWRGRRIQKSALSWSTNTSAWMLTVSNRFLYDGWNLIGEFNATNNALIRGYVWGPDASGTLQGAGGVGGLAIINDVVNGSQFPAYDGNGNVVGVINGSTGSLVESYEYDPFGNTLKSIGPSLANPLRFSTKYWDSETDSSYYGHRYYMPSIGRWANRDPVNENGGLNIYGYVSNQPISNYDLLGLANPPIYWPPIPIIPPSPPVDPWTRLKNACKPKCNGIPYNFFSQCCCEGKILARAEVPTGVKICSAVSPSYGVEHQWIEVGDWSAGFTGTEDGNPLANPGVVNIPDPYSSSRPDKVCTEIKASPCRINFTALRDGIKAEAERQKKSHGPYSVGCMDCRHFANYIVYGQIEQLSNQGCGL